MGVALYPLNNLAGSYRFWTGNLERNRMTLVTRDRWEEQPLEQHHVDKFNAIAAKAKQLAADGDPRFVYHDQTVGDSDDEEEEDDEDIVVSEERPVTQQDRTDVEGVTGEAAADMEMSAPGANLDDQLERHKRHKLGGTRDASNTSTDGAVTTGDHAAGDSSTTASPPDSSAQSAPNAPLTTVPAVIMTRARAATAPASSLRRREHIAGHGAHSRQSTRCPPDDPG
jgi:hypothetical protein